MKKEIYAILAIMSVFIVTTACETNESLPPSVSSTIEIASSSIHSEENSSDLIQSSSESKAETSGEKENSEIIQGSLEENDETSSVNKEPDIISSALDLTSETAVTEEKATLKEIPKDDTAPINSSEPSKPQDKPVEKVASSGNPASDEIEEDVYEVTTSNPTAEEIEASNPNSDIFIMEGAVCEKVTPDHWAFDRTYKQGELLGKITKTKATGNLGELEARTLPVGTEIYATDNFVIFLVKLSNSETILKYHMLIEG